MTKITLSLLFILSGCSSPTKRDTKQLEAGLDQTMQICEEGIAKGRQDLQDTKSRLASLAEANKSNSDQTQPELQKRVNDLEQTLEKTKPARASLLKAKSEIAALIYNRTELTDSDPNATKVDQALREFYAASDSIQRTVSDYLMKSSDLDEYLHAQKLYRTFHPAEFQTQVKARIESAQEEAKTMQADLNAARLNMESNRKPASSGYNEMQDYAQRYIDRANRLASLSREMTFATADAKQISNLDSSWNQAQKLRTEFSALEAELEKLSTGFSAAKSKL